MGDMCSLLISFPGPARRRHRPPEGPGGLCGCGWIIGHLPACHLPGLLQAEVSLSLLCSILAIFVSVAMHVRGLAALKERNVQLA